MADVSVHHLADADKQVGTMYRSHHSSADAPSRKEDQEMRRFAAVLAQLKHEKMAHLVSSIRQGNENLENEYSSSFIRAPATGCKVIPKPLYGSYHLAYRVLFEDGVEWILKVPANGHHACFDSLAAEALTSEALTMRMIKQKTTIPVPSVHHFDASADNEIGCPYILMDFLKGKPVWRGWFDEEASTSTLEQFRARCLQTIAAAMVQLSQFTLDRGGSLRFDSDGRPVDVAGAKVPDSVAEQDALQGLTTLGEDCPYCEKGPIVDPISSFLFMLDRRGFRENDGAYENGIREAVRLFTEWTLEKAENTYTEGPQFVLAHPDFALQNFLVEDDGTLCGIIDWDGVAAVPLSVGSLKYPDWLMNDWHPWYDYSAKQKPQQENSPEELSAYRTMYAQFVELCSSIACGSSEAGKLKANTTRMSLVAGSLHFAANELKFTDDVIDIILQSVEALTAEDDDSVVSDVDPSSSVETDTEDTEEEEHSNAVTGSTVSEESVTSCQEGSDVECLCSRCIAELAPHQPPTDNSDEQTNRMYVPAMDETPSAGAEFVKNHNAESCSCVNCTEEAAVSKEVVASRKAKVAKWALDLGEKGFRGASKIFHKEETPESQSTQKARVAKWVLGLGGKGCKRASEALHNKKGPTSLQPVNLAEAMPPQNKSSPSSKISKAVICLSSRNEMLLRKITAHLHRDSVPRADGSILEGTRTRWVPTYLKWLVFILKRIIRKPMKNAVENNQTPLAAEGPLPANFVLLDAEHCQKCNSGEKEPGQEKQNDRDELTKIDSENVWACIAAEIYKGGIPIDLIKKRHNVIAQCVIKNLGREMEQEKEKELHLKLEEAARKAKNARKQAELTNAKHGNNLDHVQHPVIVQSENAACPESITIARGDPNMGKIVPDHIRPHDDEYTPSDPQSLIFKLQVAKQRFDMEMALKGQSSWPATLVPRNAGAVIAQSGDSNSQNIVQDVATEDATEKANRKLRMLLASFAEPKVHDNHCKSNIVHVAEDSGAATEHSGHEMSKQDTLSSETIDLANQKLRAMLLSLQQEPLPKVAESKDEPASEGGCQTSSTTLISDVISETAPEQLQAAVKAGRWFETPRGHLMRIEDDDKVHDGMEDHGSISPLNKYLSEDTEGPSNESLASRGDGVVDKVSDFQLIFPTHNKSEAVNVFQVPDIDEDEEAYETEGFPENHSGRECDELEDSEIVGEAPSSRDHEFNDKGEEARSQEMDVVDIADKANEEEIVDSGYFTMGEICVALGNGNLDEQRMTRLKKGFMALLDDAVGRHRR